MHATITTDDFHSNKSTFIPLYRWNSQLATTVATKKSTPFENAITVRCTMDSLEKMFCAECFVKRNVTLWLRHRWKTHTHTHTHMHTYTHRGEANVKATHFKRFIFDGGVWHSHSSFANYQSESVVLNSYFGAFRLNSLCAHIILDFIRWKLLNSFE